MSCCGTIRALASQPRKQHKGQWGGQPPHWRCPHVVTARARGKDVLELSAALVAWLGLGHVIVDRVLRVDACRIASRGTADRPLRLALRAAVVAAGLLALLLDHVLAAPGLTLADAVRGQIRALAPLAAGALLRVMSFPRFLAALKDTLFRFAGTRSIRGPAVLILIDLARLEVSLGLVCVYHAASPPNSPLPAPGDDKHAGFLPGDGSSLGR
jgi:hypothetical protein